MNPILMCFCVLFLFIAATAAEDDDEDDDSDQADDDDDDEEMVGEEADTDFGLKSLLEEDENKQTQVNILFSTFIRICTTITFFD